MKNLDTYFRQLVTRLRKQFPNVPRIERIEFREDDDSMGEPAIYIWVLLANGTPESRQTFAELSPVEDAIRQDVRAKGIKRWPYVRFRTEEEFQEILAGSE